jgi:hypothetical protein
MWLCVRNYERVWGMFHVKHRLGFSNSVDYAIWYPDQLNPLTFQIPGLLDPNMATEFFSPGSYFAGTPR